jgi:hypothetical protein
MSKYGGVRDREMISNPSLWPNWPILPVKKWNAEKHSPDVACLWEGGDGKLKIAVGVNMFDVLQMAKADWQETNVNKVLADGWVVD